MDTSGRLTIRQIGHINTSGHLSVHFLTVIAVMLSGSPFVNLAFRRCLSLTGADCLFVNSTVTAQNYDIYQDLLNLLSHNNS